MTKIFYLANTGIAQVDYVGEKFRMVEFKDGYHPMTNDCIWRPGKGHGDAVMFVWQGRSAPEGQDNARVRFTMKESNRLKDNAQPLSVSRLWYRWFRHGIRFAIIGIIYVIILYIAYGIWTVN